MVINFGESEASKLVPDNLKLMNHDVGDVG